MNTDNLYSNYINKFGITGFHKNFKNTNSKKHALINIKPINLFIGTNNSGKSRVIRKIFESSIDSIESNQKPFKDHVDSIINNLNKSSAEEIYQLSKETKERTEIVIKHIESEIEQLYNHSFSTVDSALFDIVQKGLFKIKMSVSTDDYQPYLSILRKNIDKESYSKETQFNNHYFKKIYIPILRGLRPLLNSGDIKHINSKFVEDTTGEYVEYAEDLYLNRTVRDYELPDTNIKPGYLPKQSRKKNKDFGSTKIYTGHTLYDDIDDHLRGVFEKRKIKADYENFLSSNFFDGKPVHLTSIKDDDVVHIKIGDEEEQPIFNLGDGLQTIIIITFPIFMAGNIPTMFFIEEPETHLHAGQQRALIEAMGNKPQHMYFLSTHSNHFLDLAQERNDISIQRVYQEQQDDGRFLTCVDSLAKDTELLDELGVRASSVLLANCSIWVEGVTDKLYLRAYMKKYIEELKSKNKPDKLSNFKENLHYIFTEYQGSNLTHWYFGENKNSDSEKTSAPKLCAKAFLIADGDIKCKGSRVEELKQDLGDSFELLELKEIENYIPVDILKDASKELWNRFNSKEEADFTTDEINQEDYANEDGIGSYLENFVINPPAKRKFFQTDSGTIKDKVKLCRIAVRLMNERDDWMLTPELTQICKRIYEHILRCNQG